MKTNYYTHKKTTPYLHCYNNNYNNNNNNNKYMTQVTAAQNIENQLKPSIKNKKTEELKSKPMHGQFYQELERPSADKEKSLVWICSSGLKFNNSSPD